jgi:hypothetical protein
MKTRIIACLLAASMMLAGCATFSRIFDPNKALTNQDKSNLHMVILAASTAQAIASGLKSQGAADTDKDGKPDDPTLCAVAGSFESVLGIVKGLAIHEDAAITSMSIDISMCGEFKSQPEEIKQWARPIIGGLTAAAMPIIEWQLISGPKAESNFSVSDCQFAARLMAGIQHVEKVVGAVSVAVSDGSPKVEISATPINYSLCEPSGSLNPFGVGR